jgi:hypothetical protein
MAVFDLKNNDIRDWPGSIDYGQQNWKGGLLQGSSCSI